MGSSNRTRAIRELMAETGTNYTTALRAYDAIIVARYAESDAAAALALLGPSEQVQPRESAPPAAAIASLDLLFSHSHDAGVDAY